MSPREFTSCKISHICQCDFKAFVKLLKFEVTFEHRNKIWDNNSTYFVTLLSDLIWNLTALFWFYLKFLSMPALIFRKFVAIEKWSQSLSLRNMTNGAFPISLSWIGGSYCWVASYWWKFVFWKYRKNMLLTNQFVVLWDD